jgi:hypothetical protein
VSSNSWTRWRAGYHYIHQVTRGYFWQCTALAFALLALVNLSERRRVVSMLSTERSQAETELVEIAQSQTDALRLVGKVIKWPNDLRAIRPNPEPPLSLPYRMVLLLNSLQCRTFDPITELIRDIRVGGGDKSATLVIYSPDPWTAESYVRVNRLRFSVLHDRNRSFASTNGIGQEPLAMVLDREDRVVAAVTSSGRGRNLWPHLRPSLLGLVLNQ